VNQKVPPRIRNSVHSDQCKVSTLLGVQRTRHVTAVATLCSPPVEKRRATFAPAKWTVSVHDGCHTPCGASTIPWTNILNSLYLLPSAPLLAALYQCMVGYEAADTQITNVRISSSDNKVKRILWPALWVRSATCWLESKCLQLTSVSWPRKHRDLFTDAVPLFHWIIIHCVSKNDTTQLPTIISTIFVRFQ